MKIFSYMYAIVALMGCCAFAPTAGEAKTSSYEKQLMINDLESIKHLFETHYAPADWKQDHLQWSMSAELKKVKMEILAADTVSLKEFQQKVKRFLNAARDYHVQVRFISTEQATLPFNLRAANGKYFIAQIDTRFIAEKSAVFAIGDEVIELNERPIEEIAKEIMEASNRDSSSLTDQALTAMDLTYYSGKKGDIVPKGTVVIKARSGQTGTVYKRQLAWDYKPEKILPPGESWWVPPFSLDFLSSFFEEKTEKKLPQLIMVSPLYSVYGFNKAEVNKYEKSFLQHAGSNDDYDDYNDESEDEEDDSPLSILGNRKSFIPALGTVIWKTEDWHPFHAYIYQNEAGKKVGCIRIPHYSVFNRAYIEAFGEIMLHFQEETEALVIDQVDNPGGSVDYLYSLASMLTDQPLRTPRHRLKLTQTDVLDSIDALENLAKYKSLKAVQSLLGKEWDYQRVQFYKTFHRFIVEEWSAGRTFTNPTYLVGIDYINPHPTIRYTKPIVILINELDFSGGDFFPAIMQDNKRALTLGTKTAGAGGCVSGARFQGIHGIEFFSYTLSIAERVDSQPIENLGVTPDIEYQLTEEDLRGGRYESYLSIINQAVEGLLDYPIERENEVETQKITEIEETAQF